MHKIAKLAHWTIQPIFIRTFNDRPCCIIVLQRLLFTRTAAQVLVMLRSVMFRYRLSAIAIQTSPQFFYGIIIIIYLTQAHGP